MGIAKHLIALKKTHKDVSSYSQDQEIYDQQTPPEETNGRRRPPPRQGHRVKEGHPRTASQDVQHHRRRLHRSRVQDPVRRRQDHWLRSHLRLSRLRQEVRAPLQAGASRTRRGQDQAVEEAKEGKEEQAEEVQGYRQGQGRIRKEISSLCDVTINLFL